ncbi:class I SAM-dependent methyltransferase [Ruegeria meonggei]|uniref:Demethylrebeccamycin-D-glucose O-methyltransferase n=1 Tax=Ruegeria meonggei TaxID=1446476 RepID=A0A1X6Z4Y3_9RHOB|nr:class I SAM-dependent methyltransferase [Ruegeria meonggei]SLN40379.1 Demethylrebeccamycin-D-glucose O-methyltransferase [Ruegeria meonggei]
MRLTEAEIQVLASIAVLEADGKSTLRKDVESRGDAYWIYKENWSDAFDTLVTKGLVESDKSVLTLTETGRPHAEKYRKERPDLYWYQYQKFYTAAHASKAHSELCKRVFGRDLCQDGQTDMPALMRLLDLLKLRPEDRVLDLGCGAGVIAEFISDETGANVVGLDYSQSAIDAANERSLAKRNRIEFVTGNFNDLDFPDASFDAILSLDTLYWAADLKEVTERLLSMLKPSGYMGVFMNHHIDPTDPPDSLTVSYSDFAIALDSIGQPYESFNFTKEIGDFWKKNCAAAEELLPQYENEGNGFIAEGLIRESREDYLPDIEAGRIARYLYLVRHQ